MSKRKQVSAEEKRTRMLDLFHEKKDFYQLKVNISIYLTYYICITLKMIHSDLKNQKYR